MQTKLFDYTLPEELIAQYPADQRTNSRMLVMNKKSGKCDLKYFSDIVDYLSENDCIVFNNTKVMNARMYGRKNGQETGALIEVLLLKALNEQRTRWQCMLRPGKRVKGGTVIYLLDKEKKLSKDFFTVCDEKIENTFVIEFSNSNFDFMENKYGHIPLPPYIKREDEMSDKDRYQTIFAKETGAVAAPTAGLHFTPEIMKKIKAKGLKQAEVTLHVGPGTFKPVDAENIKDHKMHTEEYFISEANAKIINKTKQKGGKIIAVGTTCVRTLESVANENGFIQSKRGSTNIFIYPPYQPKVVDILLTNFHLPQSTLLMLVSAFSTRENVLKAYQTAINNKFRFYSYGDCMLLI